MSRKNLFLVFNRPPAGISDDEFNEWALFHFQEIVAVPGWESARRFRLEAQTTPSPPIPFPFMSLYELSGDPDAAVEKMEKAPYDFPEWFARAQQEDCFAGWKCIQLGEQVNATPDRD